MEGLMTFTGIVMIAFGILQIILFFKVWGMTNNVKRLTDKFCNGSHENHNLENSIESPSFSTADNTSDDDAEIFIGDTVIRREDGREMVVDRIVYGKYGCADLNTHTFIAGYTRNEIRKKGKIESTN